MNEIIDPNHPVNLNGLTRRYKGNGRRLGFPTANINTFTTLDDGIYFGFADLENHVHHPAIIFIGTPTTVGDTDRRVEAHLLDIADIDYYQQNLNLSLQHYHRSNQTFSNIDELVIAMKDDEKAARDWFSKNNYTSAT